MGYLMSGTTTKMLRKTAETVLRVTFGKRKGDRKTWWQWWIFKFRGSRQGFPKIDVL